MLLLHEPAPMARAAEMAERARAFLLAGQDARGAWRDFFLPAGESDGWVTAYVALALAESGNDHALAAARCGWAHLETAIKSDGGWGYNALTPSDADSTVWALRLAEALGQRESTAARRGRAFLAMHRVGGGVTTYASAEGPRGYVGLPDSIDFSGWTRAHICVSAAAAGLTGLADADLQGFLVAQQATDGHWPSYWWFDPGYATAEAVEALGAAAPRDRAAVFAAERLAALLAGDVSSAFALAHLIRIIASTSGQGLDRAIPALAAVQADNGSWPASARLRVPSPECHAPTDEARWKPWHGLRAMPKTLDEVLTMTFTITSLDHRRAFTTATVLRALTAAAQA